MDLVGIAHQWYHLVGLVALTALVVLVGLMALVTLVVFLALVGLLFRRWVDLASVFPIVHLVDFALPVVPVNGVNCLNSFSCVSYLNGVSCFSGFTYFRCPVVLVVENILRRFFR